MLQVTQLWLRFNPLPGNFHIPWVWWKKRRKRRKKRKGKRKKGKEEGEGEGEEEGKEEKEGKEEGKEKEEEEGEGEGEGDGDEEEETLGAVSGWEISACGHSPGMGICPLHAPRSPR